MIEGLLEEAKSTPEDEKWDKAEEYFLSILESKNIKQRLLVWQFRTDFPEKKESIIKTLDHFEKAFDELKDSKYFKKMLGFILSIGNILNGGTNKGQADGFYLEALSKTTTLRDVNNKTILHFICEKMKQEDEEFVEFKRDFKNVFIVA